MYKVDRIQVKQLSIYNQDQIYTTNVQFYIYTGGIDSRQIGHCNLSLIQLSKHVLWKICRHGVTIYALRPNILLAPSAMLDAPIPCGETMMGTSISCMHIAHQRFSSSCPWVVVPCLVERDCFPAALLGIVVSLSSARR